MNKLQESFNESVEQENQRIETYTELTPKIKELITKFNFPKGCKTRYYDSKDAWGIYMDDEDDYTLYNQSFEIPDGLFCYCEQNGLVAMIENSYVFKLYIKNK